MLKRQQNMESLARSRGQTIDRLTGENIRLRSEVEELTKALAQLLRCAAIPESWAEPARAALARAKGGDRG
jgi:hypothetical protein